MKDFIKWLIKLLLWYSADLILFSFIGLKILELSTIPMPRTGGNTFYLNQNDCLLVILIVSFIISFITSFKMSFKGKLYLRIALLLLGVLPWIINIIINLFLKLPNLILNTNFSIALHSNTVGFLVFYTVLLFFICIGFVSILNETSCSSDWNDVEY